MRLKKSLSGMSVFLRQDHDPVVIEKCLGHKMPKIMATYNRNEMLPQRRVALNSWAEWIESYCKDKVVYMHLNAK